MRIKLFVTSLFTLGILAGMVFAILLSIAYVMHSFSWMWLIGLTLLVNILIWLLSPYISDLIYKWFYKITFYDIDQVENKKLAAFIKKVCADNKMKVPRIGIIPDQNPTAFTYGSAAFNARLVMTEGLFTYLNEEELEAVAGHELGHIVHHDFIIMSIASTLLQILYEVYVIFARSRYVRAELDKKGEKKGNILVLIGLVSYFFYWIGTYVLLYLSRVREYYADEFSAEVTGDPNILSSALIKIAYGIAVVPDTEQTAHLLNNTRAQGIFDFKTAKEVGLVYMNTKGDKKLLTRALLFDLVSPWAWIMELHSTHPLVGKRIRRLCTLTKKPAFDFETIRKTEVNYGRIWGNFFADAAVLYSVPIVLIAGVISFIYASFKHLATWYIPIIAITLALTLLFGIIRVLYRFSLRNTIPSTVAACMGDIYASPVRGKAVVLNGKAIGRGQAGLIVGEDMMFQDSTGIIYLNYESPVPLLGNLYFGWKKVEKLIGKQAKATGWFVRGATHHLELYRYETSDQSIKSYVRFWYAIGPFLLVLVLALLIFLMSLG